MLAFAVFASGAFEIWVATECLAFSNILWPRRTHLAIKGFEDGRIKVAKGSDVEIVALADTGYVVPDTVQIRYRTEEGKSRENMSRLGVAEPTDKFQKYSFTFRGILSSRSFDLVGGDAALRDFQIDVVDVPDDRNDAALQVSRLHASRGPRSARHRHRAIAAGHEDHGPGESEQRPRRGADQFAGRRQAAGGPHDSLRRFGGPPDRRHFSFEIEHLDDDQTLLFTLVDVDGIRTKEPVRLILNAVPDEPPHVGLHLRAIGSSITPQARLPIEGEITDDYGVAKNWFEYKLDQAEPVQVPLRTNPRGRATIKYDRAADEALDFKEKPLKVGQQMSLAIMAQDNCDLKRGPNVAASERYQLTVVTNDHLMSMLEARELTLRLRLEQIVQDLDLHA